MIGLVIGPVMECPLGMGSSSSPDPRFPSSLDPFPSYLTHYFEQSAGPFQNICDLSEEEIDQIREMELESEIQYSRFKIWPRFIESRRAADDLLVDLYCQKFNKTSAPRPVYAVLGDFHRIPGLFANPGKIRIEIADLKEDELTFIYPDHAHLIQYFNHSAPPFGAALPKDYDPESMPYYGQLFTCEELRVKHIEFGIKEMIDAHLRHPDSFVYSYVEAHIWTRDVPHTTEQE